MNTRHHHRSALATLACLLALALGACKDDSPCDEGQEVRNVNCYTISAAGRPGQAGSGGSGDGADAGDGGAAIPADFSIGQPCADTTASSDCGGGAPVCAPLPTGSVCTQVLCLDGEPNAGACPSGWRCFESTGNPSVCVNF